MKNNLVRGFTLVEVLLYVGIFALVSGFFIGILTVVTRVQSSQTALLEVNTQLNFVLQTIQRHVRDSSHIEAQPGATENTIKLRTKDLTKDPTYIGLSGTAIEIKEGSGASSTITTSDVAVNDLQFVKYVSYPGHDSVQIDISMTYNTLNPQQQVSKTLRSAIARVSAATFDSSLIPGSNSYDVGQAGSRWRDGYFSGDVDMDGGLIVGPGDSSDYFQFDKSGSAAPSAGDCNSDSQRGRLYIETTNNRMYVCNGATRGWDYLTLTNQL